MMTSVLLGTLLVVTMATCQASHHAVVQMSMPQDDNRGVVENCGPTQYPFDMYWQPKDLNPEGKVTFHWNVTAPDSFTNGVGIVKLFLADVEDPILEVDQNIDCDYVRKMAPMLACPFKKGDKIMGAVTQTKLDPLAGYKGDYRVEISLTNQDGKTIFCGKMQITVL